MRLSVLSFCIWLHVVTAATAASSSDGGAPPAPTFSFSFTTVPNMTTCEPAVLSWQYSPRASVVPMSFLLQVAELPGLGPAIRNLTTAAAPPTFTWQPVNVPQGMYVFLATLDGTGYFPGGFFVSNGSNTSCLDSAVLISSSAASTTKTTQTSTSNHSTASASGVVPSSSGGSKINHGAIAGIAIAGFFVVLGAMIFILRRHRSRATRAIPAPDLRHISPMPTGEVTSTQVLSGPPNASKMALERPIAPAVVESQEAMFLKLARMREEMRIRERRESGDEGALDTPGRADTGASFLPPDSEIGGGLEVNGMGPPSDFAQQFHAMAQRVAVMEATMRTHGISNEQPPEYM
ncbi:hypothetical protein K438DRAFT_1786316 [Mycena galopus ATCC 62051]|nr:hypothetical protein K438DRAFT_1786316 [Mycena galopus ATCC 62051]